MKTHTPRINKSQEGKLLYCHQESLAVLWIRIRRIRMFLGLPDPHPDPLVTSTDPVTDPSFIKQTIKNELHFYCFVTSL
jgi:hypothetical protein